MDINQVQYTIDTVITELSLDPEKRFIEVKILFFCLPCLAPG